ncbi:MAG: DUF3417 domain-containing protein, partial [Actinobacteria bacterium]|nr:DUF3417 domain-containing protein [Actinomycetota bacterium]
MTRHGASDIAREADDLAARLPTRLAPLARLAFNYWWSWAPGGAALFRSIDPGRFDVCRENPVRLLREVAAATLSRLADDDGFVTRAEELEHRLREQLARPVSVDDIPPERPVAFLCAEYG